jgi:GGDEF domain-containing protein
MDASYSPLRNRAIRIALALSVSGAAAGAIQFLPSTFAIVLVSVAIAAGVWSSSSAMATAHAQRTARLEALPRFGSSYAAKNIYDVETGFCSEWYFLLRLEEEVERSKRTGHNFVLLNIEPRRRLGNRVRNRFLRCLEGTFRSTDRVGRLGDLRFAALLVGCELEGARAVTRRITASVGRANIQVRVAAYPHDGQDWRGLLTAAGGTPSDLYPTSDPIWTPGATSVFDRDARGREAA